MANRCEWLGHATARLTGAKRERRAVGGVTVEVLAACNMQEECQPRASNWMGYVTAMGGERIGLAGDTGSGPERRSLKVDVALLAVGGTYTMNAEDAAEAANAMGGAPAAPIHCGDVVGSRKDAERFAKLCHAKIELSS